MAARKTRKSDTRQRGNSTEGGRDLGPRLPVWKRLLFALITIGFFILVLEGLLAVFGVRPVLYEEDPYVGFSSLVPLFVEQRGEDGTTVMATAENKLLFFQPQQFSREKPDGAFRVFCMGGSTTYGRPYDDVTSFCGWLRELLPAADPSQRWELINAGGVSYASYRVALLMEELIEYEPDLFIVYSGQNEFLERRTYDRMIEMPQTVIGLGAFAANTRTYALIKRGVDAAKGSGKGTKKKDGVLPGEVETLLENAVGPSDYHRDDELQNQVIDHYRFNLLRMIDIARSAGAEVILVSPASNLRDSSPFKSEHRADLGDPEKNRFRILHDRALGAYKRGEWHAALDASEEATEIDDRYARLHFLRARALWEKGRYDEAGQAFIQARDEDICPLRALSPMLEIVKEVAKKRDVSLVDFRVLVEERSEHGVPGSGLFLDHVHPTIEGNRLLALALIDTMIEMGRVQPSEIWGEAEIARVAKEVESSIDTDAHGRALRNLSRLLRWAGKTEEAYRLALQSIERVPNDVQALYLAGVCALELGNPSEAIRHLGNALALDPENSELQFEMGNAHLARGMVDGAITHFFEAIRLNPNSAVAFNNLANAHAGLGDLDAAVGYYRQAVNKDPDYAEGRNNLGLALADQGKHGEAVEAFNQALRIDPELADAHNNLGFTLLRMGEGDEAIEQFRRAIKLAPDLFEAHLNLGLELSSRSVRVEAIYHLQEAVRIRPESGEARYGLATELLLVGDRNKGVEQLDRAVQLIPGSFDAQFEYATILATDGRLIEAISHYGEALKADAGSAETHFRLARLQAKTENYEEAILHCERSAELEPEWAPPLMFASSLLAAGPDPNLRDTGKAVEMAERGAELSDYRDPRILNTLAFAYASAHRSEEAVATAEKALALASAAGEAGLVEHLRAQIIRYSRGEL